MDYRDIILSLQTEAVTGQRGNIREATVSLRMPSSHRRPGQLFVIFSGVKYEGNVQSPSAGHGYKACPILATFTGVHANGSHNPEIIQSGQTSPILFAKVLIDPSSDGRAQLVLTWKFNFSVTAVAGHSATIEACYLEAGHQYGAADTKQAKITIPSPTTPTNPTTAEAEIKSVSVIGDGYHGGDTWWFGKVLNGATIKIAPKAPPADHTWYLHVSDADRKTWSVVSKGAGALRQAVKGEVRDGEVCFSLEGVTFHNIPMARAQIFVALSSSAAEEKFTGHSFWVGRESGDLAVSGLAIHFNTAKQQMSLAPEWSVSGAGSGVAKIKYRTYQNPWREIAIGTLQVGDRVILDNGDYSGRTQIQIESNVHSYNEPVEASLTVDRDAYEIIWPKDEQYVHGQIIPFEIKVRCNAAAHFPELDGYELQLPSSLELVGNPSTLVSKKKIAVLPSAVTALCAPMVKIIGRSGEPIGKAKMNLVASHLPGGRQEYSDNTNRSNIHTPVSPAGSLVFSMPTPQLICSMSATLSGKFASPIPLNVQVQFKYRYGARDWQSLPDSGVSILQNRQDFKVKLPPFSGGYPKTIELQAAAKDNASYARSSIEVVLDNDVPVLDSAPMLKVSGHMAHLSGVMRWPSAKYHVHNTLSVQVNIGSGETIPAKVHEKGADHSEWACELSGDVSRLMTSSKITVTVVTAAGMSVSREFTLRVEHASDLLKVEFAIDGKAVTQTAILNKSQLHWLELYVKHYVHTAGYALNANIKSEDGHGHPIKKHGHVAIHRVSGGDLSTIKLFEQWEGNKNPRLAEVSGGQAADCVYCIKIPLSSGSDASDSSVMHVEVVPLRGEGGGIEFQEPSRYTLLMRYS